MSRYDHHTRGQHSLIRTTSFETAGDGQTSDRIADARLKATSSPEASRNHRNIVDMASSALSTCGLRVRNGIKNIKLVGPIHDIKPH